MDKKTPKIQNAITLEKFYVPRVNFNFDNILDENALENLSIDIEFGIGFDQSSKNLYSTNFEININSDNDDFTLSISAIGIFKTIEEISDEFLKSNFVKVNSPAIAFPFIRSFINTITTNSGIPPLILPSFNFASKEK